MKYTIEIDYGKNYNIPTLKLRGGCVRFGSEMTFPSDMGVLLISTNTTQTFDQSCTSGTIFSASSDYKTGNYIPRGKMLCVGNFGYSTTFENDLKFAKGSAIQEHDLFEVDVINESYIPIYKGNDNFVKNSIPIDGLPKFSRSINVRRGAGISYTGTTDFQLILGATGEDFPPFVGASVRIYYDRECVYTGAITQYSEGKNGVWDLSAEDSLKRKTDEVQLLTTQISETNNIDYEGTAYYKPRIFGGVKKAKTYPLKNRIYTYNTVFPLEKEANAQSGTFFTRPNYNTLPPAMKFKNQGAYNKSFEPFLPINVKGIEYPHENLPAIGRIVEFKGGVNSKHNIVEVFTNVDSEGRTEKQATFDTLPIECEDIKYLCRIDLDDFYHLVKWLRPDDKKQTAYIVKTGETTVTVGDIETVGSVLESTLKNNDDENISGSVLSLDGDNIKIAGDGKTNYSRNIKIIDLKKKVWGNNTGYIGCYVTQYNGGTHTNSMRSNTDTFEMGGMIIRGTNPAWHIKLAFQMYVNVSELEDKDYSLWFKAKIASSAQIQAGIEGRGTVGASAGYSAKITSSGDLAYSPAIIEPTKNTFYPNDRNAAKVQGDVKFSYHTDGGYYDARKIEYFESADFQGYIVVPFDSIVIPKKLILDAKNQGCDMIEITMESKLYSVEPPEFDSLYHITVDYFKLCTIEEDTDVSNPYVDVLDTNTILATDTIDRLSNYYYSDFFFANNIKNYNQLSNVRVGRQIDSNGKVIDYLNGLLKQVVATMYQDRLGVYQIYGINQYNPNEIIFDENNIQKGSFKRSSITTIDGIYNQFEIKYHFEPAKDQYKYTAFVKNITDNTFPLSSGNWKSYVSGVSNYDTAKEIWEYCHTSYLDHGVVIQGNEDIQVQKWIINDSEFGYTGESISNYMLELAKWYAPRKTEVKFSVPMAMIENLRLELLQKCKIKDILLTKNQYIDGVVTALKSNPSKGIIDVTALLFTAVGETFDIIESGDAVNQIIESGNRADTITETGET